MKTEWIEAFAALSKTRNIGQAFQQLGISATNLSRYVEQLEARIGSALIQRGRRGDILPTPAGLVYGGIADRIATQISAAGERAPGIACGVEGVLRIGLCEEAATPYLAALVRHCRAQLPELRFQWHEMPSDNLVTALKKNDLDVALLIHDNEIAELTSAPLWRDPWSIILPGGAERRLQEMVSARDIVDINLVIYHENMGRTEHDLIRSRLRELDVPIRVSARCRSRSTMMLLTLSGVGATFVPASLATSLIHPDGQVSVAPFDAEPITIAIAYRRDDPAGSVLQFLRCAQSDQARPRVPMPGHDQG